MTKRHVGEENVIGIFRRFTEDDGFNDATALALTIASILNGIEQSLDCLRNDLQNLFPEDDDE